MAIKVGQRFGLRDTLHKGYRERKEKLGVDIEEEIKDWSKDLSSFVVILYSNFMNSISILVFFLIMDS